MSDNSQSYKDMSNDELISLYHNYIHLANLYDVYQKVKKVLLNSLYGAVGNNYFIYYKKNMARSITLMGQCMINKAAKKTNEYLSKILCDKAIKDRRIYSDTDSVVGDTKININGYDVPIRDAYDNIIGSVEEENEKSVKKVVHGYMTNTSVGPSEINYIMKHRVNKRMYRVTVDGKECIMTEDHSLMVMRDGELIMCRPSEVRETDSLVVQE